MEDLWQTPHYQKNPSLGKTQNNRPILCKTTSLTDFIYADAEQKRLQTDSSSQGTPATIVLLVGVSVNSLVHPDPNDCGESWKLIVQDGTAQHQERQEHVTMKYNEHKAEEYS